MNDIVIYTDGSCLDNPGPGGWAAVLTCDAGEKRICGGAKETTNNRMELMAVINALSMLKGPSVVTVYSDSQYIIRAFNDGWIENWKKRGWTKGTGEPVANKDLWQTLELSARQHTITWVWVKGHADNAYNNICDKMARATAAKYARGELPAPGQADQDDFTIPEEDAIGSEDYAQMQMDMYPPMPEQPVIDMKRYESRALLALDAMLQARAEQETGLTCPCGGYEWCELCKTQAPEDGVCACAMAYIDYMAEKGETA